MKKLNKDRLSVVDDMVLSSNFDDEKLKEIGELEKNIHFRNCWQVLCQLIKNKRCITHT